MQSTFYISLKTCLVLLQINCYLRQTVQPFGSALVACLKYKYVYFDLRVWAYLCSVVASHFDAQADFERVRNIQPEK